MAIEATIREWAPYAGMHHNTLKKRVTEVLGKAPAAKEKIGAGTYSKAIQPTGLKAEQERTEKGRADKLEMENAVSRKELIPSHEVAELMQKNFGMVVSDLRSFAVRMANKFSDPDYAYQVLSEEIEFMISRCRQKGEIAGSTKDAEPKKAIPKKRASQKKEAAK